MLKIFHSEDHIIPLPPGHRFPIQKYKLVREHLEYEGSITKSQLFSSEFINDEIVTLTHSKDFWERVKSNKLNDAEIRRIGFPRCEELFFRSLSSASGTVQAALAALKDGAGMNLAGGTHHAFRDYGEGYCLINDIAVASNYLLSEKMVNKILIIDLDVHQGNGTANLFSNSPEVFTFSMHCSGNYPFKKEKSDLDVELPVGAGDSIYLEELKKHIPSLLEKLKPDIVFYQAGVDILDSDLLGKLNVSIGGCRERDDWVISQCRSYLLPIVVVMGGGYNQNLNTLVRAHCNTYKSVLDHYEVHSHFLS